MGRWSRQLAPRFVSWLRVPGDVHWLDVGCGTGALTNAICGNADPASVVGCDPVEPFIEYARQHSQDVRASFAVAGTGSLPNRVDGYGSVTSLFALNFFPDPKAAIDEMRSLAARGFWTGQRIADPGLRKRLGICYCQPTRLPGVDAGVLARYAQGTCGAEHSAAAVGGSVNPSDCSRRKLLTRSLLAVQWVIMMTCHQTLRKTAGWNAQFHTQTGLHRRASAPPSAERSL